MVVFVIGLGSMGKRRIRLLKEYSDIRIIGIESNSQRREEAADQCGIDTYESIEAASMEVKAECAFVCTSPLSHSTVITNCLEHGYHVFTELNLVADGYEQNIKLAREKHLVLFLSSTFLYRYETAHIIDRMRQAKSPVNYIYHIGQYLPDWHPWESYNNFFVGNARTNGCREIFAIELPWLISCFGPVEKISVLKSRNTELKICYDDNYLVQILHKNGTKGSLAVDVVSRKAVRKFEAYSEDLYLTWDGTPDTVVEYDYNEKKDVKINVGPAEHHNQYASFITENPYREEVAAFLKLTENPKLGCAWDFERDLVVLKLIDRIEGIINE